MIKTKNIFRGMGTIFNLWPTTPKRRKSLLPDYKDKSLLPDYGGKTPQQVDAENLYSDWVKIGLDMSKAIEYYTDGQKDKT
jgi:hypothetical protein